jgi:hypothetical protein
VNCKQHTRRRDFGVGNGITSGIRRAESVKGAHQRADVGTSRRSANDYRGSECSNCCEPGNASRYATNGGPGQSAGASVFGARRCIVVAAYRVCGMLARGIDRERAHAVTVDADSFQTANGDFGLGLGAKIRDNNDAHICSRSILTSPPHQRKMRWAAIQASSDRSNLYATDLEWVFEPNT